MVNLAESCNPWVACQHECVCAAALCKHIQLRCCSGAVSIGKGGVQEGVVECGQGGAGGMHAPQSASSLGAISDLPCWLPHSMEGCKWWSCDCKTQHLSSVQVNCQVPGLQLRRLQECWDGGNFDDQSSVPFIQCWYNFKWSLNGLSTEDYLSSVTSLTTTMSVYCHNVCRCGILSLRILHVQNSTKITKNYR